MPPKKEKTKPKTSKKPIPEDFELSSSSEETKVVKLDEEKRMRSKDITFNCGHCGGKLLLQNSIEINPKGVKCRCNGCSFKLSRNDKTMNVSKNDDGGITLDSEDHSISFSFNRLTTPESDEEKKKYEMIQDVMTPRHEASRGFANTPKNSVNLVRFSDMD